MPCSLYQSAELEAVELAAYMVCSLFRAAASLYAVNNLHLWGRPVPSRMPARLLCARHGLICVSHRSSASPLLSCRKPSRRQMPLARSCLRW